MGYNRAHPRDHRKFAWSREPWDGLLEFGSASRLCWILSEVDETPVLEYFIVIGAIAEEGTDEKVREFGGKSILFG